MKYYYLLLLFLLPAGVMAQSKYAVILSAISQSHGTEKIISRNNFNAIHRALEVQGFASSNILSDTVALDQKKVFGLIDQLTARLKPHDFVLIYSDLPAFSVQYPDSTWEYAFSLTQNRKDFLRAGELAQKLHRIAAKTGDGSDMFFTIIDSELPAPLEGKKVNVFNANLLRATDNHLQKRVIQDNISVFTKAVARVLTNSLFKDQSYERFRDAVRNEMYFSTTQQSPALEVSGDLQLFRGYYLLFPPHFNVLSVNGNKVQVNAGNSLGYETGAAVKFYKAYTSPLESSYIGEGTITSINPLSCIVDLNTAIPLNTDVWAYIQAGNKLAKLQFNTSYKGGSSEDVSKLLSALNSWKDASLYMDYTDKGGDLAIGRVKALSKDSVEYTIIQPANGLIYSKVSLHASLNNIGPIIDIIRKHARFKEIYGLRNYVPELSVKAELIPASPTPLYDNGYLILHEHDIFSIRITNTGTVPVYFNILDMMGDRSFKVLVPYDDADARDFRIEPGKSLSFDEVQTDGYGFGLERLKIFTSREPFDLRPVVNRSLTRGSANDKLSQILGTTNSGGSRFATSATRLDYEQISITNVDMEIRSAGYARDHAVKKQPVIDLRVRDNKTMLRLKNTSEEVVYFNVLAPQQDGSYVVVYPSKQIDPYDCNVLFDTAANFVLPAVFAENDQVVTVYSDRPFNLNEYVNAERDINQLLLEIMREGRISGTPHNKISVVNQLYKPSAEFAVNRDGSNLSIKLLTPKVPNERSLSIKSKTKAFDLAGMAYAEGYTPVKGIKINGQAVSYDPNLKLFEKSIDLQSGSNKVVIEAVDEKGFSIAKTLEIELEGGNAVVKGEGKNYFLGIGVNKYKMWPELFNAESDVVKFAELLKNKYRFASDDVTLLLDTAANRKNIINRIRYFLTRVGPNDNVIIYLSGHGNEDQLADGDYYFIPQESDPSDVTTAVKSTDIVDNFKRIKAKHCILIVDACYSGMITNSVYGVGSSVAVQKKAGDELPSKWIITSGRATKVLDGEPGKNSPFAASLINYLRDNSDPAKLTINKLVNYLEDVVPKISNQKPLGKQIDGEGEMVFKPK